MNNTNHPLFCLVILLWLPLTLWADTKKAPWYGQWRIVSLTDSLAAAADTGKHVFADTDGPTLCLDKTGFNGNSGCNRYSGTIERTGKHRVRLAMAGSTRRYCPDVFDERRLFTALRQVVKIRRCGKKLTLKSADGRTVIRAVRYEFPK